MRTYLKFLLLLSLIFKLYIVNSHLSSFCCSFTLYHETTSTDFMNFINIMIIKDVIDTRKDQLVTEKQSEQDREAELEKKRI